MEMDFVNHAKCNLTTHMLPVYRQTYVEKLNIEKLNTDENQQIRSQYGVVSIPTLIVFKDGEKKRPSGFFFYLCSLRVDNLTSLSIPN
jgi:hypothetical protein